MFPDAPVSTFAFRVAGMCGLSSSVMLIIAKISSRVSPLSLLTLSNEVLRMFHQVTVSQCGCDPLLDVIRFANDSSSHSSYRWMHQPGILPSVHVGFHSMGNCSVFEC